LAVLLHFRTLSSLLEALPPKDPLRQITLVLEEPLQGELVMQSSHVSWVRRVSLACSCSTSSESSSDDEDDDDDKSPYVDLDDVSDGQTTL
jgi:hypothetical protein